MRDLSELIGRIIFEFPQLPEGVVADLKDIQSSWRYASPEIMSFWWREASDALNQLGPIETDWQKQLAIIWSDGGYVASP